MSHRPWISRANVVVEVGQRWMSNDPRRLSAFVIKYVSNGVAVGQNLYPPSPFFRVIGLDRFSVTGSKGYMQI